MSRAGRITCIILLALLVRVVIAGFTCPISTDGITYIGFARSLLRGEYVVPLFGYRCILYPLLIILFNPVSPDIVMAGQAASIMMGIMTVLLVYFFGRRVFGERVAVTAALLGAVQPYMCRYSGDVLTETTYTFFLFLAAFIGLGALKKRRVENFLLFGFAAALAYFTKTEGLVLPVFIGLWIFLGARKIRFGRKLVMAVASAAFIILLMVTQMYFYYLLTGRMTVSEKLSGSIRLGQVEDTEKMFYDSDGESSLEYTPPFLKVSYYTRAVVTFFELLAKLFEAGPVILVLLLVGLLFRRGKKFSREEAYIASLVLFFIIGFSFIRPSKRFVVPLLPFLLYWSAMGLDRLRDFSGERLKNILSAAVIIIMLGLTFRQAARVDYRWRWSPEERAGLWLKENSLPGPRVVSRKAWVSFYAGGERIPLPLTYDALLECTRGSKADYFVFRDSRLKRKRPGMIDRISPADMEIIHTERDGEDSILIYRFLKD